MAGLFFKRKKKPDFFSLYLFIWMLLNYFDKQEKYFEIIQNSKEHGDKSGSAILLRARLCGTV